MDIRENIHAVIWWKVMVECANTTILEVIIVSPFSEVALPLFKRCFGFLL